MEYNFREIEKKWQKRWRDSKTYEVPNESSKPKCYVLDMFPYPSGAGLHVGHPLGYIASDIYARYKRLKGFNVLHPMGYDSFGLPAEQYALETGQHPAVTTEKNIETFRSQLDNIGFSFDWSREVRTSDPKYYKWTQWIFLQIFNSWFDKKQNKARRIEELIKIFEEEGSVTINDQRSTINFSAEEWKNFSDEEKQEILMNYRLAYSAFGEVNWCEALGTVLANDEVINGVSERGGHPVVKKKMRQWYLRITDYAERLLQGLETVDFSYAMKEMQRNWIGRSEGAQIKFPLIPAFSPGGEGEEKKRGAALVPKYSVSNILQFENAKRMRKEFTEAENILWQQLRNNQLNAKFRRQHPIDSYIVDFICPQQRLIIEIDGGYHETDDQRALDEERTKILTDIGFNVIRFTNNEVTNSIDSVIEKIKRNLQQHNTASSFSPRGEGRDEGVLVFTTRPDTIFGVDFMVLAPEHELVNQITTLEQKKEIEKYLEYVKSRSERERLAEVKQITGAFTGAYAINPFNEREIPVWISEYVLVGYGTGAIMAVPCGDQRDYNFARHFNIPITNIIGEYYNGEEANPTKDAILTNSGFLNGMIMKDAIPVVLQKIEDTGIGKRQVNYKMRDAGFSRQRYWGEPFPIIYKDGVAYAVDGKELPIELPYVESYKPGPEGEGPLANITEWVNLTPDPSPKERGEAEEDKFRNREPALDYMTTDSETWKTLKPFARENRKASTEAEDILWQNLRNRKISNQKFRRQHAIAGFIVDFVCIEKKLVIEIDGDYHLDEEQKKYDISRTEYLNDQGFIEIRFSNQEVIHNLSQTIQTIEKTLSQSSPLLWRGVRGEVRRETNTMPGYAGSSWYFLRYMDPHNDAVFADKKATDYWNQVDVYVGGTEHAVGHLLYSRLWTKILYDLGYISFDEPYKKLVNQGMIQGSSRFIYRLLPTFKFESDLSMDMNEQKLTPVLVSEKFYEEVRTEKRTAIELLKNLSKEKKINSEFINENIEILGARILPIHVEVDMFDGTELNIEEFQKRKSEYANAAFLLENGQVTFGKDLKDSKGKYFSGVETEKMSKSKYNTVNPNDIIEKYGADTFRMYEMFLGPVEQSKPWDTKGIEGVHRFLKKLWRLFYDEQKGPIWTTPTPSPLERAGGEVSSSSLSESRGVGGEATDAELKILHKTIKKIEEDTERFSYNTAVSAFMVCVNELTDLKCHKKEILEPLLILLAPYAPHIAEELYQQLNSLSFGEGRGEVSILNASFPKLQSKYLVESEKEYPVSINAKMRTTIKISLDASDEEVEKIVLQNDIVQKWIEGKPLKKFVYVKNKMINVVV